MIVEVLVSAIILVMVSLAVFSSLDSADKAAGTQQRRAMAANFAQSELERIRSLPVEDIAALRGVRTVKRDNINYTYTVDAKWISDGGDEPQCTSRTGGLDYMRITVKIAWEGMGKAKAVSFTSLMTPTAGAGGDNGSVSVHLINRLGAPVSGVGVTLDGPSTYTGTTNENGCVIFAFIPASLDYTLKFSRAGYVNADSEPIVTDNLTVTARETTKLQYVYDSGGYTSMTFRTYKQGQANTGQEPDIGDMIPTRPAAFQMFHAEQINPGKTIALSGTVDSWNGFSNGPNPTPFFPFTTPYQVYAGNCSKNIAPSATASGVNIAPLVNQGTGFVKLPAVSVVVRDGTGSPAGPTAGNAVSGATVMYDAECGVRWSRSTDSNGRVTDHGVPYAKSMKVCALTSNKKLVYEYPIDAYTRRYQEIVLYANANTAAPNTQAPRNGATDCFA